MHQKDGVPAISALTLRFFRRVAKRYFRRHFRSVMVQHLQRLSGQSGPLIVYANHSSWWDPLLMILLAQAALPDRRHYGPMDAAALARYPIFRRLGIFPVEMTTARGAAMFLRTSMAVLRTGGVLWLTPQGRFADPRSSPLSFRPGLGALVCRMPEVRLLPMAVEYTFWDERLPEALVRFGESLQMPGVGSAEKATTKLEAALAAEMQVLQTSSIARDASLFHPMVTGQRGTGGFYALGRRLKAWFSREPMQEDHTPRGR